MLAPTKLVSLLDPTTKVLLDIREDEKEKLL
jgi:hypothetical protein